MGECIGLDFGTTYSVVSHLVKGDKGAVIPEPIDFGGEERTILSMETLVVNKSGTTRIGIEAVPAMRAKGATTFKGFKMLLDSSDSKDLKQRGYIGSYTPEYVTSVFMKELFKKVQEVNPECKKIEKVVVGVPYVWTENGEDSRKFSVVNIVKKATKASVVEFQSEPTLACAYFAYEINQKRHAPFNGHILVIDYGGGTLDVTLCKVEQLGKNTNIEVCKSWGAGENTEGKIGSAGLSFMEKVADILLAEADIRVEDKSEREYQSFVKQIEVAIKDQSGHLKTCLNREQRYFSPRGERYDEEIDGMVGYYKGEEYIVKYRTLLQAYNETICPILTKVLSEAKRDMDALHIPYDDYANGTFKIATIGGFCNFALTEKQIRRDTDWLRSHQDQLDTRYTELDEVLKPKNRELAIAHGAALNANGVIRIKTQFPYTLCFYGETFKTDSHGWRIKENGHDVLVANESEEFVMFRENEEYEPGRPVFLCVEEIDKNGQKTYRKLPVDGDSIPYIRRKKNGKSSPIRQPIMEMKLPHGARDSLYIAMAMERNEGLTLYVYNQVIFDSLSPEEQKNPRNRALIGEPSSFPNIDKLLGSFYKSH